jgi:hypothetical protein
MSAVAFSRLAGSVFLLVAVAHLCRAVTHAAIQLGSLALPVWVSWGVVLGAGTLGLLGLRARPS